MASSDHPLAEARGNLLKGPSDSGLTHPAPRSMVFQNGSTGGFPPKTPNDKGVINSPSTTNSAPMAPPRQTREHISLGVPLAVTLLPAPSLWRLKYTQDIP